MQVCKMGDGLAVTLPADVVEKLGLADGDNVAVQLTAEGTLEVTKVARLELLKGLRKYRGSLPADFKFDREWANSRGCDDED